MPCFSFPHGKSLVSWCGIYFFVLLGRLDLSVQWFLEFWSIQWTVLALKKCWPSPLPMVNYVRCTGVSVLTVGVVSEFPSCLGNCSNLCQPLDTVVTEPRRINGRPEFVHACCGWKKSLRPTPWTQTQRMQPDLFATIKRRLRKEGKKEKHLPFTSRLGMW